MAAVVMSMMGTTDEPANITHMSFIGSKTAPKNSYLPTKTRAHLLPAGSEQHVTSVFQMEVRPHENP